MKALVQLITVSMFCITTSASAYQTHKGFQTTCKGGEGLCDLYKVVIADDGAILEDQVINHGGGTTEVVEGNPNEGVICSKKAMVPKPVYDAVMNSMNQIAEKSEQGSAMILTESEKTMLLFYNTIMQQFSTFDCR